MTPRRQPTALSDTLIAELQSADILVIGAPMYNFGIASTLKAWFDHVLRAGITFRYGESGPEGLLKGKRAIVIESRGGLYSEGPAQVMDAQEPHLRGMLRFMGITADVRSGGEAGVRSRAPRAGDRCGPARDPGRALAGGLILLQPPNLVEVAAGQVGLGGCAEVALGGDLAAATFHRLQAARTGSRLGRCSGLGT